MDTPQWSLFVEYVLNIAFAVFLVRISNRALTAVLLISAAGVIALAWTHGPTLVGVFRLDWYLGLLRGIFPFCAGMLVYRLVPPGRIRMPWGLQATALILVLLLPVGRFATLVELIAILVLFPAIVAAGQQDGVRPGLRRLFLLGGALSYPIYILHDPLIHILARLFTEQAEWRTAIMFSVAEVIGMIAIGWLALKFIDEPLRRRLGQWVRRRAA